MPKYLYQASYTTEGAKGLVKEGGSKRRAAVEEITKALGGKLEAFYYAFGESDVFVIVDVPDHASPLPSPWPSTPAGQSRSKQQFL